MNSIFIDGNYIEVQGSSYIELGDEPIEVSVDRTISFQTALNSLVSVNDYKAGRFTWSDVDIEFARAARMSGSSINAIEFLEMAIELGYARITGERRNSASFDISPAAALNIQSVQMKNIQGYMDPELFLEFSQTVQDSTDLDGLNMMEEYSIRLINRRIPRGAALEYIRDRIRQGVV